MDEPILIFVAVNNIGGQVNMTADDTVITVCPDGSYCCGFNNTACCLQQAGYWIKGGKVYSYDQYPFSSSSSNTVSDSTSTPIDNPITTQSSNPTVPHKNVAGIGLGVGLGVGIPVLLLISVTSCLLIRRKRSNAIPSNDVFWETQAKIEKTE